MAARIATILAATTCDAVNLRVHLPGIPREEIREQIRRLGEQVVPRLKALAA